VGTGLGRLNGHVLRAEARYLRAMPRTLRSLIPAVAAVLATAVVASPAQAQTFKVTSLTHSSSSSKTDGTRYSGSSTSTWRLAPATKDANNRISVIRGRGILYGSGMINVRGTFAAQATTDWPASCSLTAPTGSEEYPAVAPMPVMVSITKDPEGRPTVAFTGIHATLGNPYFGTECSTSNSAEADPDIRQLKRVKASIFKRRNVTIRFAGATNEDGIAYRWSTVFKLKRVKR
jgi:hypothetical protein